MALVVLHLMVGAGLRPEAPGVKVVETIQVEETPPELLVALLLEPGVALPIGDLRCLKGFVRMPTSDVTSLSRSWGTLTSIFANTSQVRSLSSPEKTRRTKIGWESSES